jgi:hypothetical protein
MTIKPGRLPGNDWRRLRPHATAIWNANYAQDGTQQGNYTDPWTVMGPEGYDSFPTHAEAVAWAFKQAREKSELTQ